MRLFVDRERCIGAAQCVLAAPGMFDQSDTDGRVILLAAATDGPLPEVARTAVHRCPSGALSLAGEAALGTEDARAAR